MTWFKKNDKANLGVCSDCVYRCDLHGPICWITGAEIKKGMSDRCDCKYVDGCLTCANRISDIMECRGKQVCQCCVANPDVSPNRIVNVKRECRKYIHEE